MNNLIKLNENMLSVLESYLLPISLVVVFVVFFLLYILLKQKSLLSEKNITIVKHEEKIKFLRQIQSENEYKQTQKEHATEKSILELHHTIKNLEEKINDGTKNQVVAKLEAYKTKRERQLKHINLG